MPCPIGTWVPMGSHGQFEARAEWEREVHTERKLTKIIMFVGSVVSEENCPLNGKEQLHKDGRVLL